MHHFQTIIFPSKIKWNCKWLCNENSWHVMYVLESRSHKKNVAKRATSFGHLVWKLCMFEVPCSLGHVWSISLQPYMRNPWSWTFWKWERKIFNFHVGQNFIWSFLDDVRLSWSWSKTFPFLESSNYRSPAIFGNSWPNFKFFNVSAWHVKWDLFEHEWSISNHFPPPNPQLTLQLTSVDFYGPQMICTCTDEFWAFNTWPNHFKMILGSHELIIPTLGLWSHGKCSCCLAQLNLLTSLAWWLDGLCNEQCNVNDLKWKCMYKWEVQIWGATKGKHR